MGGCSICGHIILADTDDWENPLCYQCWEEEGHGNKTNGLNYWWNRFQNLRKLIRPIKQKGEDVEEVLIRLIRNEKQSLS